MNDLKLFFRSLKRRCEQIDLYSNLVVPVTYARAALPAHNKKGNSYAGLRQTNYLILWTQVNQLSNK